MKYYTAKKMNELELMYQYRCKLHKHDVGKQETNAEVHIVHGFTHKKQEKSAFAARHEDSQYLPDWNGTQAFHIVSMVYTSWFVHS